MAAKRALMAAILSCIISSTVYPQTIGSADSIYDTAGSGDLATVKKLIEQDATLVRARDDYRRTPLHHAVQSGRLAIVEYLVSKGADINAQDNALATPLYEAANFGKTDILEFLLSKGADFHIQSVSGSPIRVAALLGEVDTVRILIEHGADPKGKDTSGETPLHSAIRPSLRPANMKSMVELLLSKGADIEAKDDRTGATPLHVAATESSTEAMALLIIKGANVKARTQTLETPLHLAAERTWKPKKEIVDLLLSKGADVDAKDFLGCTPLHRLVMMRLGLTLTEIQTGNQTTDADARKLLKDQLETIELLLSKGADANAKDDDESTALHRAASVGRSDIAEVLLSNRADKNARNKFGTTPLGEALKQGHQDVADYLRARGATE